MKFKNVISVFCVLFSSLGYQSCESHILRELDDIVCLKSISNGDDCNLFAKKDAINNYDTTGTYEMGYYYEINHKSVNDAVVGNTYYYSFYTKKNTIWTAIEWGWETDYYEICDVTKKVDFTLKEKLDIPEDYSFIIYRNISFSVHNNYLCRDKLFFDIKFYKNGSSLYENIQSYLNEIDRNKDCFHGYDYVYQKMDKPHFIYTYSEEYYSGEYSGGTFKYD